MFLFPVEFLTNHFKILKTKIDYAALNLLATCYNYKNQVKINETWDLICYKLKIYEKECISNCLLNLTDELSNEITDKIKLIEIKMNSILIDYNLKHFKDLEQIISDVIYRLQKFLFLNKSYLFVEKKSNNNYVKNIDMNTFFGKLICITNEYLSKSSAEFFIK